MSRQPRKRHAPTRDVEISSIFGRGFEPEFVESDDNQYIYVQLSPGPGRVSRCLASLKRVADSQPDATYGLAGVTHQAHAVLLVFGVDFGPRTGIPDAGSGDSAVHGFDFISAVMSQMFEYLPRYVSRPDAAAQVAATHLIAYTRQTLPQTDPDTSVL